MPPDPLQQLREECKGVIVRDAACQFLKSSCAKWGLDTWCDSCMARRLATLLLAALPLVEAVRNADEHALEPALTRLEAAVKEGGDGPRRESHSRRGDS